MTAAKAERAARKSQEVVAQIAPLLHGLGADVQGAALADLLAMWLAGHLVPGDPAATADLREAILQRPDIADERIVDMLQSLRDALDRELPVIH